MPTPAAYSRPQIVLHWLTAALIVSQYVFSGGIEAAWRALRRGAEAELSLLVPLHVLGGLAVLGFAVWRLVLRARHGVPPAPGGAVVARLVHLGHLALYAVLIAMAVSGGAAWFGGQAGAAAAHGVLKVVLMVLVAGHVVMALWHQFVLRDGVMARMR